MLRVALPVWALGCCLAIPSASCAQILPKSVTPTQEKKEEKKDSSQPAPSGLSDAEKIARLQTTLAEDRKLQETLKKKLQEMSEEVLKASKEFVNKDSAAKSKTEELEKLQAAGKAAEAKKVETELADLQKVRKLAEDRFRLVVQERKILLDRVETMDQKIVQNQHALDQLLGVSGKSAPGKTPSAEQPANEKASTQGLPKEVAQARSEAEKKEELAREAEQQLKSVSERIKALENFIALEHKLLENAQQQAKNAYAMQEQIKQEQKKKSKEGTAQDEQTRLQQQLEQANRHAAEAKKEVDERTAHLAHLQQQLAILKQEQAIAQDDAAAKKHDAEAAKQKLAQMDNPFSLRNIVQWLGRHGPKILLIALGMIGMIFFVRFADRRFVQILVRRGSQKTVEEREKRANTLVSVFHNAAVSTIVIGGTLMILQESGVPIVPLLGGAAVVGLAVAFGAQNLIKDYFYGFVILVEHQYAINDVVRIGSLSGVVERVTLRVTVLRGLDGTVHYIPHGQVQTVSNLTQEWSRALFNIGVAYKEDVDLVIEVLKQQGKELRRDPLYSDSILEDLEMLGVDELGDSAVVIQFFIKTRPMKQWSVKREFLRRIKKRFDKLGIEIPFPQRSVTLRRGEAPAVATPAVATPAAATAEAKEADGVPSLH